MNLRYFRVEGGHDADPDPEQSGRMRLRDIARHDDNVKTEDLPFSQGLAPISGNGGFEFNRPPLPGTLVVAWVPEGAEQTGYAHPLGIPIGKDKPGSKAIPGNSVLPNRMESTEIGINIPAIAKTITQANRSGIEQITKEIQEKGKKISFKLLQGIPTHGADFLMSGIRNSPLTQISTALDSFDSVLSGDMLSALPGVAFGGLSDIVSSVLNEGIEEINDAIGSEAVETLQNIMLLMPSESGSGTPQSGFMISGLRVNPEVVVQNILNDLKSGNSVMNVLQSLESKLSDPAFTGMDQFANITQTIAGGFGNITQTIDMFGNITSGVDDIVQSLIDMAFGKFTSILGAGGTSVLTEAGTPMKSLIERIPNATLVGQLQNMLATFTDDNAAKDRMRNSGNSSGRGVTASDIVSGFTDRLGSTLSFSPKSSSGSSGGGVYS